MDCYQVALFVTLGLVLQCHQIRASNCNRRTTFIQIRIPQRTNVAIKYPKEINPVQFVPFPYNPSGTECIKCQDTTCNKCTYIKNTQSSSNDNARQTNIIINIKKTRYLNESTVETTKNDTIITNGTNGTNDTKDDSSATVDGTIVGLYDKTWAASKSGATAKSGDQGNSSAATASGTSLSQIDVIAAINEEEVNRDNGKRSNVEDVYVESEDNSNANANSTAASNSGANNDTQDSSSGDGTANPEECPDDTKSTGNIVSDKDTVNTPVVQPSSDVGNSPKDVSNPALPQPSEDTDKDKANEAKPVETA